MARVDPQRIQDLGLTTQQIGASVRISYQGIVPAKYPRADGTEIELPVVENLVALMSALEALKLARSHPDRDVVFLAIGFETTTPATAVTVLQAAAAGIDNFSVLVNHVLTPAALQALGRLPVRSQGFSCTVSDGSCLPCRDQRRAR